MLMTVINSKEGDKNRQEYVPLGEFSGRKRWPKRPGVGAGSRWNVTLYKFNNFIENIKRREKRRCDGHAWKGRGHRRRLTPPSGAW